MRRRMINPRHPQVRVRDRRRHFSQPKKTRAGITPVRIMRDRHDVLLRLLILGAFFALAYYGIRADWPLLRHIDVQGGVRLSDHEVIRLAALDDFEDAWTILVPRETIRKSLEANPLIEHAEVSIAGPSTVRITIIERRPIAALDCHGFRFLFDRSGELIDISEPDKLCLYPIVRGVPPGLLRFQGEPFHTLAPGWELPDTCPDRQLMELQLNRLIHLQYLLNRRPTARDDDLLGIRMDDQGALSVEYDNCPPVLLGKFENPGLQFRRMLAVLEDETITDPRRTIDIDLSSELFPCYHVREQYFTPEERRQIEEWRNEATVPDDGEVTAETVDSDTWVDPDPTGDEVILDMGIFSLSGGEDSDDE